MLYSNCMDVADLSLCGQIQVFLTEQTCQKDLHFVMCVCVSVFETETEIKATAPTGFFVFELKLSFLTFTCSQLPFVERKLSPHFIFETLSECHIIAIMKLRPAVNYVTHKNTEVFLLTHCRNVQFSLISVFDVTKAHQFLL